MAIGGCLERDNGEFHRPDFVRGGENRGMREFACLCAVQEPEGAAGTNGAQVAAHQESDVRTGEGEAHAVIEPDGSGADDCDFLKRLGHGPTLANPGAAGTNQKGGR